MKKFTRNFLTVLIFGEFIMAPISTYAANKGVVGGSCDDANLKFKLSDLNYIGKPVKEMVPNSSSCVLIKFEQNNVQDATAGRLCKDSKGESYSALNPGNPQYINTNEFGSETSNNLGYYFCLEFNKEEMCGNRKNELKDVLDITWRGGTGAGKNKGNCMCKKTGANVSEELSCSQEVVEAIKNSTDCPVSGAIKDANDQCVCATDKTVVVKDKSQKCPEKPPEGDIDKDLDACFSELKKAKELCSEAGEAAIEKCSKDAPEVNNNISTAQRVLGAGLGFLINGKQGSGAYESCQMMSATGAGVIGALSLLKKTCDGEIESCKKSCADIKTYSKKDQNQMLNECKAKFEEANSSNPGSTWTEQHTARFSELAKAFTEAADAAENFCIGDMQNENNKLQDLLGNVSDSVQQADICKCQLKPGVSQNITCDEVASPLECMKNMNQPGCSYTSLPCAPGQVSLNCQNNNSNNLGGTGIQTPGSGFASPGFSSGGDGVNSAKVSANDLDIGNLYDESRPSGSGTASVDMGSPFGVATGAAGGGGGGIGGSGGGDGSSSNASSGEDDGKEKKGISGFFQAAKGSIASLFGRGKAESKNKSGAAKDKAYKNDANGYRPRVGVRGMANVGEFGSKNRDIWKVMNQRYSDQTHTFISTETP